jgi:hypothetical protein
MCQIVDPNADKRHPYDKPYLNVFDEIVIPGAATEDACDEFVRRVEKLYDEPITINIHVYGDASGNSHTTKARATDYKTVQEKLRMQPRYKVFMSQNTSNPPIIDRVNEMNTMLRSASGSHRVFVDPSCKNLIRDFREVAWKRDRYGNRINDLSERDRDLTHLSDACGYLIWKEFRRRPTWGLQPGTIV